MLVKKLLLLVGIFISLNSFSQTVQIFGIVTGTDKAPINGASVHLKSSFKKATTDAEGKFVLSVDSVGVKDSLIFNLEGYEAIKVLFDKLILNYAVTLKESNNDQNEVVEVGYGTQKKKDVIGSISTGPKDQLNASNNNFSEGQKGAVSGVSVTANSSSAEGNNTSTLVRGRGSILSSTAPLIVLDGSVYAGSISDINPNDIESIENLKDASSIAIYGSRGSNGVIMIKTKQGKKGRMVFKYDGSYGISSYIKKPDLMNGTDFYNFKMNRILVDSNASGQAAVYGSTVMTTNEIYNYQQHNSVDWFDLATQKGNRTQHTLSLSGSTEKTRYFFSGSLLSVQGIAKNDQYKRYTLRSNVEYKAVKWLTITSNTQLSVNNRDGLPADISGTGTGVVYFNPLTTPYDSTGKLTLYPWDPYKTISPVEPLGNPLSNLLALRLDNTYKMGTTNNVRIDFPFLKGLSYKLNTGVEMEYNFRNTYYGMNTVTGFTNQGKATNYNHVKRNFLVENILNYGHDFGVHSLGVTLMYSSQSNDYNSDSYTGTTFPSDVLTNYQMSSAAKLTQSTSYYKQNNLSQLIRLNYGYKGRYLLTVSTRRDGYSAFGDGKKYGIFPSAALGWQVSQEPFFKRLKYSGYVSNLKLRTSYGITGNQAVSAYSSLANFSTRTYVNTDTSNNTTTVIVRNGVMPSKLANPLLGWESQKEFDLGLDLGLLKGRINIGFDYYDKNNYDVLLPRTLPPEMGIISMTQNIGKVENTGVELTISTINVTNKNFTWSTQINYSHNNNRITELYGNGNDIDITNGWFKGQPINVNYGYKFDGVLQLNDTKGLGFQPNSLPGFVKVKNVSGNATVSTKDMTIIGQTDPKYHFGFSNNFKYNGFSLSIFFQGAGGNTKLDNLQSDNTGSQITNNVIRRNWWTRTNPTNEHWANDYNANPLGVKVYEDASFIRLRDVTLSYNIPTKILSKASINNFRIYITARNIATFTKFKGIDPELDVTNATTSDGKGGQWGLPLSKEYTMVVSLTF